jgi:hypothetical protein
LENHAVMSLSMWVMFARGDRRMAPTMMTIESGMRQR